MCSYGSITEKLQKMVFWKTWIRSRRLLPTDHVASESNNTERRGRASRGRPQNRSPGAPGLLTNNLILIFNYSCNLHFNIVIMDVYLGDLEHVTLSVLFKCTSISIFQLLCSLIKRKLIFIWLPFCLLNTANAVSEGGWWCDVSMASFIFSLIPGSFQNASVHSLVLLLSVSPKTTGHKRQKFVKQRKRKCGGKITFLKL